VEGVKRANSPQMASPCSSAKMHKSVKVEEDDTGNPDDYNIVPPLYAQVEASVMRCAFLVM
jgi:hypothetical protein